MPDWIGPDLGGPTGLLAFMLASLLIELTPGPNMGFLAIVAATRGRRHGLATVLGIGLGLLVVGALAAAGLAVVISRSALAYGVLRWGGVLYLLWLAWTQWRDAADSIGTGEAAPPSRFFRHGLVVNLLNPKAAVFYVAVLPTFISRTRGDVALQAALLTLVYVGIATAVHLAIVALAGQLRPVLDHPSRRALATRALSLLLVGVAVWLAVSTAR